MVALSGFAGRIAPVLALGLAVAACQSSSSSSGGATRPPAQPALAARAPSAPPADAPGDQDLYRELAGNSIVGFNAAGQPTCEYYRADGALMTSIGSQAADGTWTVDGQQACQQLGGAPVCKIYAFGQGGSVQYWYSADNTSSIGEVVAGNRC